MDTQAITFQKKLNGWYLVLEGARNIGFVAKANAGWICTTRSGERIAFVYPRRIDAAYRLSCEYARERNGKLDPVDVALAQR